VARYRFRETVTNRRNGRKMYVSACGRYTGRRATHVRGDLWETIRGRPGRTFVVQNARKKIVLANHGKVVYNLLFDARGDSRPGDQQIRRELLRSRGSVPTLEPFVDLCDLARRLLG
jgi:hypothetical protein